MGLVTKRDEDYINDDVANYFSLDDIFNEVNDNDEEEEEQEYTFDEDEDDEEENE